MNQQQNKQQESSQQENKQHRSTTAQQDNRATATSGNDFEAQNRYWQEQFKNEPYYNAGQRFDAYEPAYRAGMQARTQNADKGFEQVEDQLRTQYEANAQQQDRLDWSQARQAARAAWDHTGQCMTGSNASGSTRSGPTQAGSKH